MSYRSIKRVLGETSLERKCRWLFGICLLSLIAGSFWWYFHRTEQQLGAVSKRIEGLVLAASRRTGRGLIDSIIIRDHWEKWAAIEPPNPNSTLPDFTAYFSKSFEKQSYTWRIIVPDADGAEGPQDEFERREVLEFFQRQSSQDFNERRIPEKEEYQYYQAVRAKQGCTLCHQICNGLRGTQLDRLAKLSEGDLAAVVKVAIPDAETQQALRENQAATDNELRWNRAILIATGIITAFLAMMASWAIVKYIIVKPLKHLRDVSDEISHGNIALRADIHTGDEFEELGLAFNRMVRHLTTIQEELRNVNQSLDGKVDELAQVNMRLYEMNRLKSDFLATMSHELRTPLNAIIGFSDVLGSIASLDDRQKRYVKNIQTSGKVLLEMINDILDLAKIESGKMEVRLSAFRIEPLLAALCDMARPLTERKNIDLDAETEPGLGELFQDQAKVQQILNNLLSNAIKFTPEGGRIVVSAKRGDHDNMILQVADTGVGISDEDQISIFEKFRQGRAVLSGGDAMTREYSGTGLGLSIVKELCKLLGGEISLSSELGKGSTFTVELPWSRPDPPKPDGPLAAAAEDADRPRRLESNPPLSSPVTTPVG